MRKHILPLSFLLVLQSLFFSGHSIASADSLAQADVSACSPIDIVFLVDQSSSMSGANGGIPTDPLKQREYAIKIAIDQLADIALDLCPEVTHRIAVISYGTVAEVDLPLSEISPDTISEAVQIRADLKQNIVARNMGQTNPQEAFNEAERILNTAGSIGDEARKRAIIFITDGEPCVGDACINFTFNSAGYARDMQEQIAEELPFDGTLLEQETCLQTLRARFGPDEPLPDEERTACLEQYQVDASAFRNSTYIWTILLRNEQPYSEELRRYFEEISASHAGRLIDLSNNRQEVPSTFTTLLEQLTGVRAARLNCGSFAVNPYLERARLNFFKFDESVKVSLSYTDVNGIPHDLSEGEHDGGFDIAEYNIEGANERYVLNRPYPGIWELRSEDCDGLDARYEPITFSLGEFRPNIAAEVPQRDLPPYYDEDLPIFLEYQMRDAAGDVVPQADHPQFAVDILMTVIDSGGNDKYYPMEWVAEEQLFRSTEPLQTPVIGAYSILVTGDTFQHEGEPAPVSGVHSEVFNAEWELFNQSAAFDVFPVTPFVIEVLEPTPGEVVKPIHGQASEDSVPPILPLLVRARIVDREGEPFLNLSEALLDEENALRATVSSGTDSASATLHPDSTAPGEFVGEITGFERSGDQELIVALNSEFNSEYYPDNRQAEVTFLRVDEVWRFDIVAPGEGEELRPIHGTIRDDWPLPIRPLSATVQLVDESGLPYDPNDALLTYAPTVLSATLSAGDQTTTFRLTRDPDTPGQYIGEATDFDPDGTHRLIVDLGLEYPGFTPESQSAERTFSRTDGFWNRATTYYGILALIIIFILANIYRYFAIRTNPVRGSLIFLDGGNPIAEFGLYNGKNWIVIKRKTLNTYLQLDLKQLKVYSLGKPKRSAQGDDALNGFVDEGNNGVRVDYRIATSGQRHTIPVLSPHVPQPYGDGAFSMQFVPPDS